MAMTLANQIQLITKYSTDGWDKVYKTDSRAALLTQGMGLVKFSVDNARVVRVAKVSYGGLSDYNRNNVELGAEPGIAPTVDNGNLVGKRGYQEAAASLVWETRELTQDRGAKYVIENFDDEETAGLAVGAATTEINRTIVVPEVDAYCFSQIAKEVKKYGLGNYIDAAIDADAPLAELNAAFKWMDDHQVPDTNRIAFVSTAYFNNLRSTKELYRRLDVEGSVDKKVSFKIVSYEGVDLVVVSPDRFNTEFTKSRQGGYFFPEGAKPIDFIVMDKGAAVHVVKYNKTKILTGEAALANTDMDATVLFVRIYHDVFVFDNKVAAIYVHVGGYAQSSAVNGDFHMVINPDGIITSIVEQPAGLLTRVYKTTRATVNVGDPFEFAVATDLGLAEGTAFTAAGENKIIAVQGGRVVAVKTLTITGNPGEFEFSWA